MDQVDRNYISILSGEKWITSRPRQIPQFEIISLIISSLLNSRAFSLQMTKKTTKILGISGDRWRLAIE